MVLEPLRETLRGGQPLAVSELARLSDMYRGQPGYIDTLILMSADHQDQVSNASTWLLKRALETGSRLSQAQTKTLIERLPAITWWGAQLHLCQMIHFLDLPANYAAPLIVWLRPLRKSDRPFLRAWALDATCEIARQRENFTPEALAALEAALHDEAASVKARARRIARGWPE